jgi:transcriptional regulator with XRE-family HTH domain
MKESPDAETADPVTQRIARRVHGLRQRRGLSLEALAQRSGVSRSMISLVERGESSPTAAVLERLATGLGVMLASLFEDDAAPPAPLVRLRDQLQWRDPDSGYLRRNLSPPNHPSPIQLVQAEMPPGASVTYDSAARDNEVHQQIWVIEGALELRLGDELHHLDAGDCLAMRLDRPIAFGNAGRKPARYIVAIVSR